MSGPKISNEAVVKATGQSLDEWYKLLDKAGAKDWDHPIIARYLADQKLITSSWWCQMVTVQYEYARGKRSAEIIIPKELAGEFKKQPKLQSAFNQLPPSHRREYVNYINDAKQITTKLRRVASTVKQLTESGKS